MFQRIVATAPGNVTDASNDLIVDGMTYYSVQIHSRPSEAQTPGSLEVDKASPPWVITLDNFVTAEECEKMIELG